jgi:colanic acid/amylovoran biosynthesis glycosyltransferase
MRLLIAFTQPFSYSETFIHNQVKYLEPVDTLTNGWMPFQDANRKSIFNGLFMVDVLRGACKKYLPSFYFQQYQKALKNFLVKQKIEVVLAEYGITACNFSEVCESLQIPLIAHFHGFDAYEYKTIENYKARYLAMAQKAAKIIVVSEDMRNALLQLGIPSEKIINNPYGVELENFQTTLPAQNANQLISVGRLTGKKAPQLVIRSFALVKEKIADATLVMIGGGELQKECADLIQQLNLQDSVKLAGVKSPQEISDYLKKSKIFVQHSLRSGDSEGTPNTILEASATGLPIVSTKHAGIREAVVDGQTGYLVEEGEYEIMAKKIIDLLGNPSLVASMGAAARKHMEQHYEMSFRIQSLKNILIAAQHAN